MDEHKEVKPSSKGRRLHYIDNLRTLLIILVILWHMAVTYGAPGFWSYKESQADEITGLVFTLFSVINGPYVLGFFFMIAGYFTPGAYDRRGPWVFIRERLVRLGIPLLIYIFFLDPLIYYALRVNSWGLEGNFLNIWGYKGAFWIFLGNHIRSYSDYGPGVGPLWFVELLLIFTIIYGLVRLGVSLLSRVSGSEHTQVNHELPSNTSLAIFALVLGIVIFIMRIWLPINSYYEPLGLPMAYVPQYIALFFGGVIASRRNWIQRISTAMGKLWLGIVLFLVLVLFPVLFILVGALEGNTDAVTGGLTWQSFVFSVWEEFICVGMIILLLVWFREKFNRQGAFAKTMSESTYTVYFIHAPVLVFLALSLRDIRLYPLLKWTLVSPAAIVLCFAIAYLIKRTPVLNKIL